MTKKLKAIGISFIFMATYLSFQLIYLTIVSFVFGIRHSGVEEELLTENFNEMISSQTLIAIVYAAIFSMMVYYVISRSRKENILKVCSFKKIDKKNILISIIGGISFLFINAFLVSLISRINIFSQYMRSFEEFSDTIFSTDILLMILSIGIIAPIIEEIIFRGLIFRELKKTMSITSVVIIQAVLFGIFHMRIIQMIYATILGLFLGLVFIMIKSIWAPILVHVCYNLTSVLISTYGQDTIFMKYHNYFVIISFIIIATIIIYLIKNRDLYSKDEEIKI